MGEMVGDVKLVQSLAQTDRQTATANKHISSHLFTNTRPGSDLSAFHLLRLVLLPQLSFLNTQS